MVTSALNRRRRQRAQWVPLQEDTSPPLLDDEESRWTEDQQRLLSRALLTLIAEERRLCELHYHGGVGAERLATMLDAQPDTIRKRLQRIRDKLRKEIEMDERQTLGPERCPMIYPRASWSCWPARGWSTCRRTRWAPPPPP